MTIVSVDDCNAADSYNGEIKETMICAGVPDVGGKDACQGPNSIENIQQGLHLTAKIQDRGYGLGSLQLKPRFETEPELSFILRSPKPLGLVWISDRFNHGLV